MGVYYPFLQQFGELVKNMNKEKEINAEYGKLDFIILLEIIKDIKQLEKFIFHLKI
jgi:hypothetical protein